MDWDRLPERFCNLIAANLAINIIPLTSKSGEFILSLDKITPNQLNSKRK
jgi:hypothetical protein